ncbi:TIGR03086 family metal-binding protein [Antrihabitans cavernicola]|uniref:TIGR03086 family protein n=1 Tax=Antrihabitans cavernicola TaxID=2495913 RepID=A0A5A7S723_9NOCA|nr:TIGR03086 family metal-binding protein [Spelaeibacter cavernicola]KAA0018456.1 TIGR03086 family protein [Spelaeibacter cavernicola]
MPINNSIELDRRAVAATVAMVDRIVADDLTLPTPCGTWNLADLLAHMTVQQDGFADAAAGIVTDVARWEPVPLTDPVAQYRAASERVVAAFAQPGVADREFLLPEILLEYPFAAELAIGFHLVDNVVHAWDVAAALGVPIEFDAAFVDSEVLAAALAVAQSVPDGPFREEPGSAFAPGLAVVDGASTLDQILLLLGRSPGWENSTRSA